MSNVCCGHLVNNSMEKQIRKVRQKGGRDWTNVRMKKLLFGANEIPDRKVCQENIALQTEEMRMKNINTILNVSWITINGIAMSILQAAHFIPAARKERWKMIINWMRCERLAGVIGEGPLRDRFWWKHVMSFVCNHLAFVSIFFFASELLISLTMATNQSEDLPSW